VSPRLATARRITAVGVVALAGLVVTGVLLVVATAWAALSAMVSLAVATWLWWLIGRQVAAIGYAERADDLLVTRGILFRELVVVPYGRMQLVDVQAGPLDRRFGIARLQLHTAAATTDASIPGLPVAEAGRLRDQLAALGEARSAGL
jgi:hypothetical protein